MPELFALLEAAEFLRLTPSALYSQRHRSELPGALGLQGGPNDRLSPSRHRLIPRRSPRAPARRRARRSFMTAHPHWRLKPRNASHIVPANVTWVWDGRIPRGVLSLRVGMPGWGKSTLAYDLSARVTRGQLRRSPANVLIATSEDSLPHTAVPRLMSAAPNSCVE